MILSFLQRLGGVLIAIALAVAALVFASVILAVAAAIAIVVGGWLWWRTRHLRRELERRAADSPLGATIEGEYRRLDEP